MTRETQHAGQLQRGLKNRHIQLIALGGAIGTGLFLGSAGVLKSAGPSMILGYAIAALFFLGFWPKALRSVWRWRTPARPSTRPTCRICSIASTG